MRSFSRKRGGYFSNKTDVCRFTSRRVREQREREGDRDRQTESAQCSFPRLSAYQETAMKHSRSLASYFTLPIELSSSFGRARKNAFFNGICIYLWRELYREAFTLVNLFTPQTTLVTVPTMHRSLKYNLLLLRRAFYDLENMYKVAVVARVKTARETIYPACTFRKSDCRPGIFRSNRSRKDYVAR